MGRRANTHLVAAAAALLGLVAMWRPAVRGPEVAAAVAPVPHRPSPFVAPARPLPALARSGSEAGSEPLPEAPAEPGVGSIVGQVLDDHGVPVAGAVVYATATGSARALVADDDGAFTLTVPPGSVTVEAGFYDGVEEWRSPPLILDVAAGAVEDAALEILLGGAGHAVQADVHEAFGIGWVVGADDGALLEGDVLVEVGGRLLTDLQPEAVRATLRERPGAAVDALVLRDDGRGGLAEVAVQLVAR